MKSKKYTKYCRESFHSHFPALKLDSFKVQPYPLTCDFPRLRDILKLDPSSRHLKPNTSLNPPAPSASSLFLSQLFYPPVSRHRHFRRIIALHCHLHRGFQNAKPSNVTSKKVTPRLIAVPLVAPPRQDNLQRTQRCSWLTTQTSQPLNFLLI